MRINKRWPNLTLQECLLQPGAPLKREPVTELPSRSEFTRAGAPRWRTHVAADASWDRRFCNCFESNGLHVLFRPRFSSKTINVAVKGLVFHVVSPPMSLSPPGCLVSVSFFRRTSRRDKQRRTTGGKVNVWVWGARWDEGHHRPSPH